MMSENVTPLETQPDSPVETQPASPEKTISWREPCAVLLAIFFVDTTVYHGAGFAGLALLLFVLPLLFWAGITVPRTNRVVLLFAVGAAAVAAKLLWCGNAWTAFLGFVIFFLFAAAQSGIPFRFFNLVYYLLRLIASGAYGFADYFRSSKRLQRIRLRSPAAVLVPLLAVVVFAGIFVGANPDLQETLQKAWDSFVDWLGRFSDWLPTGPQIAIWIAAGWIMIGLLRPLPETLLGVARFVWPDIVSLQSVPAIPGEEVFVAQKVVDENAKVDSPHYLISRNTLLALSVLFAVYLVFEFYKNWTRDFPSGFDYSRHMHLGAAYLTFALGLSTVILCIIFQESMLRDSRIGRLKRLAVIWSILNFLLAFSVYNRLYIYIDLNGLSRLRIIGLLGTTAVVLGLVMVVRMFLHSKKIDWLLQRYAWSMFAVVFLGLVFPFDMLIAHYNVSRVMQGDLAPSIFLLRDPNSAEDYLASLPLLDSDDPIIREGAWALFAEKFSKLCVSPSSDKYEWTAFQWAEKRLLDALESRQEELDVYQLDYSKRQKAIERFRKYTDRWI